MRKQPILYIVIPCYNEEKVLPITSGMFLEKINTLAAAGKISPESRVLFVNDGSKDSTWNIITELAAKDEHYIGISQSRNRGHQNAVLAGLMEAKDKCDITISIDCDGQDDINAMDEMVDAYRDGCEVVYGVRSRRDTDTFFKRFTAEGFYHLMNFLGADIVFNHADYRLISSRVLQEFANFKEVNIFLRGMVPLVGFKSTSVYYERHHQPEREANPVHHRAGADLLGAQLHRGAVGGHRQYSGPHGGGLGLHHVHRLLHGRHSAAVPGRDRRIHRQDLSGDQGPAPLHHQRAHLGKAGGLSGRQTMEIERKWMVTGWPEGLPMAAQLEMEQGYVAVRPTVRIRRESVVGGETHLVLCFKGEGTLSREEIETDIAPELYEKLKKLIGKPMILKTQRRYALPGGLTLEVNLVDEGQPGCFWYAEVEFETEAQARAWKPEGTLAAYLSDEVTGQPGQSMGAYWAVTRLRAGR